MVPVNPRTRPYLSQHDDGAGVQSQEGAVLEPVLHQQATHEGREATHNCNGVGVACNPGLQHDEEGIHSSDDGASHTLHALCKRCIHLYADLRGVRGSCFDLNTSHASRAAAGALCCALHRQKLSCQL